MTVTLDEYDRPVYDDRASLPADAPHLSVWRGRVVGEASTTLSKREHSGVCVDGWIPSGDWWFHCSTCRPERRTEGLRRHLARCTLAGCATCAAFDRELGSPA